MTGVESSNSTNFGEDWFFTLRECLASHNADLPHALVRQCEGSAGPNEGIFYCRTGHGRALPNIIAPTASAWTHGDRRRRSGLKRTLQDRYAVIGTFFRHNVTDLDRQSFGNLTVIEPCNYASNVAYYRSALELCAAKKSGLSMSGNFADAVGALLGILGWGSAFMHGSRTALAGEAGKEEIAKRGSPRIIGKRYNRYQVNGNASLHPPPGRSPTPRRLTRVD